MSIAAVVLTDQASPSVEKTESITAFMFELMAVSEKRGDLEVALNALLGAYMNLAQRASSISVKKAARALVNAARVIGSGEESVGPAPTESQPSKPVEASNNPRPSLEAVVDLANRLNLQLKGQRHEVGLSALLTLVRTAALQFTCCTESCAHQCLSLGQELLASSSSGQREPGTPVH